MRCVSSVLFLLLPTTIYGFASFGRVKAISNSYQSFARLSLSSDADDCGCAEPSLDTVYGGKPSNRAREMNPRQALADAKSDFFRVTGERVNMDSVLNDDGVEIVVFLRSFG
mmetsp:Transcript_25625/g.38298  ORF Transcript_25625/g.38298 Transcript_25625/m.38298 type:complete len:112 (+) Transcript_25625:107-442(+)